MKSLPIPHFERARRVKQRGVVLFFTLIALLVMSLAAVALIRSVDTSTMIAGNMAFKQSTTTSADAGIENAIDWLNATQGANASKLLFLDATHTFNMTDATKGYYSNASPSLDLFADATWNAITDSSNPQIIDSSGNKVRFIVQRMCLSGNALPSTVEDSSLSPPRTACLFSAPSKPLGGNEVKLPQKICDGSGCPNVGQSPQFRITARAQGPRFAVSYVQAFVY
jgi:Tfp pilus assembly protein PilX